MPSLAQAVDLLHALADPTRVRLMALLEVEELSVAETVEVTELPQSRVSTHLGRLREAGLLRDRRAGSSTFYAIDPAMSGEAQRVWGAVRAELDDAIVASDRSRARAVVEARTARAAGRWPESVAGEMERHYSPGRTWEATARGFAAVARLGDVLDVGAGDGTLAELLAPSAVRYVCLDRSATLVSAARARLRDHAGVECVCADATALPYAEASFDTVLLFNVLTFVDRPSRAIDEAARVLRPGGDLVLVTLDAHESPGVSARYGHVHPGFRPAALGRWLSRAGLVVERCSVTSRERRAPRFSVVTAVARRPSSPSDANTRSGPAKKKNKKAAA
jgi:ArsR family transcriptional regulator